MLRLMVPPPERLIVPPLAVVRGSKVGAAAAVSDLDRSVVGQVAGEVGCCRRDRPSRLTRGDGHAIQRGAADAVDHGAAGGGEVAAVDGCGVENEVRGAVGAEIVCPVVGDGRGVDLERLCRRRWLRASRCWW